MVPPGLNLVPISNQQAQVIPSTIQNISPSQLTQLQLQNQLALQQLQQQQHQQQQQGTIIQQPQQSGQLLPIHQQIQGLGGIQNIQNLLPVLKFK